MAKANVKSKFTKKKIMNFKFEKSKQIKKTIIKNIMNEIIQTEKQKRISKMANNGKLGNTNSRCAGWIFTVNNPFPAQHIRFKAIFDELCRLGKLREYVFQLEKGESGTLHLQGYLYFPTSKPNFDYIKRLLGDSAHIEQCKRLDKAKLYCCKLDTRVMGPWTNIPNLRYLESIEDPLSKKKLYPWQQEVIDIIKSEKKDDRTIYWYWESDGNKGKSALVKHLILNYGCIVLGGMKNDMYYSLSKLIENRKNVKNILVDIPRSLQNKISMSAFESIKNGVVFSGKYESCQLIFNSPTIIIFANFPPEKEKLSYDRWNITEIDFNSKKHIEWIISQRQKAKEKEEEEEYEDFLEDTEEEENSPLSDYEEPKFGEK